MRNTEKTRSINLGITPQPPQFVHVEPSYPQLIDPPTKQRARLRGFSISSLLAGLLLSLPGCKAAPDYKPTFREIRQTLERTREKFKSGHITRMRAEFKTGERAAAAARINEEWRKATIDELKAAEELCKEAEAQHE